jgi:sugar phosphate isomerase/epimerase
MSWLIALRPRVPETFREQKGPFAVTSSAFTISGFGDEIADDPAEQLDVLVGLDIHHLDLRGAWGRNVLDFDHDDVQRLKALLSERGARVAMIASPVGKSQITEPASYETERLETAIGLADAFETPLIRMFSFYYEGVSHADSRDEVVSRLGAWARIAESAGVTLLLENEGDLWGDTPIRCHDLLSSVGSPALRLTLDTGNFAALGVASHDTAYGLLKPWLSHIQIKDVRREPKQVVPAGQGDGQIPELLAAARRDGYQGYLSLEPHLAIAGKAGGFSGADLFGTAAEALRTILADLDVGSAGV